MNFTQLLKSALTAGIIVSFNSISAFAGVFNPETFTLDNGMEVVVIPNHRVPVVTHMVWYRVGSADEAPNESGIAHFLEHLMFKGTRKHPNGAFSEAIARHGGRENAFTSLDYTAYHQTIAKDRLEMVMELEADRMTNLTITDKEVEPERQVVLEERRSRVENNPGSILGEQISAAMYLNHPYRNPVIGWEHDIKAMTLENILAFYKRWYAPNNAILVVAGDITAKELKPLAEKYYGPIPRQPEVIRNRPKEPPQRAAKRVTMKDPRVRQASWRRTYLAPALKWRNPEHVYPLEIFADILGSGASSHLYRELVINQKLAVSAGAYYSGDGRGPGRFTLYASPSEGTDIETLEKAVVDEVLKVVQQGVSQDDVKRAQDRMMAEAIYARDSMRAGARVLGSSLAVGLTIEDVENWPERITAVTPEQISEATKNLFDEQKSTTGVLLPAPKSEG